MSARRYWVTMVGLLCGAVCVAGAGFASSAAARMVFGEPAANGVAGAGQLYFNIGIAIDQETGDAYVPEFFGGRVSKFDGAGDFLSAWGWGVNEEDPADELQICTLTTGCQVGRSGSGSGQFSSCGVQAVAADNDTLSSSYKDVYVVDDCDHRVQKFDSAGKFLLMFGGHVNATSGGDVCVAGEACQEGVEGAGNGEFEFAFRTSGIAVGPAGAVYVGDEARVQVFEPSGVWRENISLVGLSNTGKVTALAVNASGDVFVVDEGVSGVRELSPAGVEIGQFDTGSTSVEAITLDASGDLFVADSSGGLHFLKFGASGEELESFGENTASHATGMAFSDSLGELYVSNGFEGNVWTLALPAPGPLVETGSETASPGERGAATLSATVDSEGGETTYHIEYVDQTHYQANGFASASSVTGTLGAGCPGAGPTCFEDQAVSTSATGLIPGETYHYRVTAKNGNGTATGPDQSFVEVPPALVEGPWAVDVTSTGATIQARVDPLGATTSYTLEYGISTNYEVKLSGSVGEGTGYVSIGYHRQELLPGVIYHYRLTVTNEVGTVRTVDQTFTTQAVNGASPLPDGRAWELVSPPDKEGALIEPSGVGDIQAAADGSAIFYTSSRPVGENVKGSEGPGQIISRYSSPGVWHSEDITAPVTLPEEGEQAVNLSTPVEYSVFSSDLSVAVLQPESAAPLSSEATERTVYIRDNSQRDFIPLVTPKNVPSGTKFGGSSSGNGTGSTMRFVTATPDLSHVVLESGEALTSEGVPIECENSPLCGYTTQLFEWSGGRLQMISILPDGEPLRGAGPQLAPASELAPHAISSDGRRIAWTNRLYPEEPGPLYLRDMVERRTVRVGGASPEYETMSSDGSRIFYLEGGELYEFTPEFSAGRGTSIDITANHGSSENDAGVKNAVIGASEDGSYVYFVATGVLADGGESGEDNLYVAHYGGSGWQIAHIGILSIEDEKDWYGSGGSFPGSVVELKYVSSRVSPNGRYLAFMSNRSLTGYDNVDAVSGQPDEEVFLYDATAGRLSCASCDPTGARPDGVLDHEEGGLLVDRVGAWGVAALDDTGPHWLAGSLPMWPTAGGSDSMLYQPRFLSDSGRLFFDSPDALVSQDTNGLEDVYEYEPVGVGAQAGCGETSATFSSRSDGCVSLISSGTASSESAFYDASESGDDVFFVTSSRLVSADYDTAYDVYDAHVCSSAAPCVAEPVSPPPCTSGDSCKAAPSPQPEIFGPTPSATFSGQGNLTSSSVGVKAVVKPRALTRAQKLARALKQCRREKAKGKRVACERSARRRYDSSKSAGKTKATGKVGK